MKFRSENKIKIEGGMSSMTDLVFLLLIFFIVSTSFVNEIGISSTYKDSNSLSSSNKPPLSFYLPGSGKVLNEGNSVGLEGVAPKVRNISANQPPSVIIAVGKGAKAGLATQVMDQALLAGAKAVKLTTISE